MEVKEFERLLLKARGDFRYHMINSSEDGESLKSMLKKYLDECTSEFEEEILKESLQEEFVDYLNCLKVG